MTKHAVNLFILIISVLSVLLLWQAVIEIAEIPPFRFPSPTAIFQKLWQDHLLLAEHWLWTCTAAISGVLLALMLTIILGALMSYSTLFHATFYPHVLILQLVPTILISPLLILWLGFGIASKIFIVTIAALFPMLRAFLDGIKYIDPDFLVMFKNLNATSLQMFTKLYFPYGLLRLFSGIKIAITYCLSSAMVGEFMGSEKGIGVYIQRNIANFRMDAAFAGIFVIVISTAIFCGLTNWFEKKIIKN